LELSVCRSTHWVPQQVSPAPQSDPVPPQRQAPLTQLSLGSQVLLHAPQCKVEVRGS
jgi:hypothetical protein